MGIMGVGAASVRDWLEQDIQGLVVRKDAVGLSQVVVTYQQRILLSRFLWLGIGVREELVVESRALVFGHRRWCEELGIKDREWELLDKR